MADIISTIAPVFVIMALGWGLGFTRAFTPPKGKEGTYSVVLIKYVNYVAIPALLIRSLASRDLPAASELQLLAAYYSGLYVVYFLIIFVIGKWFKQSLKERAIYALVACFANIGFVGLPIAQGIWGDEGLRLFLVIMSVHSLTLLPITLFLVEHDEGEGNPLKGLWDALKGNIILISLLIGLMWSALGVPYPLWLDGILALPAQTAAPVGLFAGGLALSRVKPEGDMLQSATVVGIKLILVPLIVWITSRHIFDLPDLWVEINVVLAALPAGLIPYMVASGRGIAPRRAASALLISAPISAITLAAILLMIQKGWI